MSFSAGKMKLSVIYGCIRIKSVSVYRAGLLFHLIS